MAKILALDKVTDFEKQTYRLYVASEETEMQECYRCKKKTSSGYFCRHHKTLFCINCAESEDITLTCKGVLAYKGIFRADEIVNCILYPIKEIIIG